MRNVAALRRVIDEQRRASSSPTVGVKLGSYRLVARVADIPSGTVYDARLDDTEASLVLLHPGLDEEARVRVLARLLGVLRAAATGLELDVGEDALFGTYVGCALPVSTLMATLEPRSIDASLGGSEEPSPPRANLELNTDLELDLPAPRAPLDVDEAALTTLRAAGAPRVDPSGVSGAGPASPASVGPFGAGSSSVASSSVGPLGAGGVASSSVGPLGAGSSGVASSSLDPSSVDPSARGLSSAASSAVGPSGATSSALLAPPSGGLDAAALPPPREGGFGIGLELEIDSRGLPLPELDEPIRSARRDDGWRPVVASPSAPVEEVMARDPGFWPRVPVAFFVPFLGLGTLWLAALTIMPVVPLFIPFGLGFGVAGLVLRIVYYLGYLGLLAVYYRQSMQVGADDDDDDLSLPRPHYRMPDRYDVFAQGAAMTLLGILGGLAVYATTKLPPTAALVALSAGAFVFPFYLLMALTMVLGTGRITAAFDPILVVRGILAGGLPYLAVGAAGGLTWMVASRVMGGLAEGGSLLGLLFALLLGVAAPAYFFGVLGYLMGRLVAVRADRFESLFE